MAQPPHEIAPILQETESQMRQGDLAKARSIAKNAIDAGIEHPFLLKIEALWLHANGQYQEALRTFHHARTLSPEDASILNGIAGCVAAMGGYEAALKLLDASFELAPASSSTHYLRGWVLEAAQNLDGAQNSYERAVELSPDHVQALARLAYLMAKKGDTTAARKRATQALALAPQQALASVALAMAECAEGDAPAAETRMRGVLEIAGLPANERGLAWGVLADALDAQSRTADASQARRQKEEEFSREQAARPPI